MGSLRLPVTYRISVISECSLYVKLLVWMGWRNKSVNILAQEGSKCFNIKSLAVVVVK